VQSACNPRTPLSSALFRGKVQPALDTVRKNESNIRVRRVSRREQRYFYEANNAISIQVKYSLKFYTELSFSLHFNNSWKISEQFVNTVNFPFQSRIDVV